VNLANRARFRMMGQEREVSSQASSHPLPKYSVDLEDEQNGGGQTMLTLVVALTVIIAMGFIPASFVVNLVQERISDSKHQQLLAGLSQKMYWMSHYASDMINFMVPVLFCWLQFVAFQIEAYSGENSFPVLLLLTAYGVCMSPFMYCWEGLFQVPSMAYVSMICINIFLGTTTTLATTTMDLLQNELPEVKPWNTACKQLFPVFVPSYNLGKGLIDIATNHFIKQFASDYDLCQLDSARCGKAALDWDVAGKCVFWMLLMAPVWFMLRLFLEWRVFKRRGLKSSPAQRDASDKAVQEEAARVAEVRSAPHAADGQDALVVWNLSKTFRTGRGCFRKAAEVRSVRGISVGVAPGECFGLLGVNGAGKTTTMRMITGDTEIGGGDVTLGGWSIRNRRDKARKHLGYCPQFDALPDRLTARQTLVFYALLRGVVPSKVDQVVNQMIGRMCLEAHQHRLTQHLSGGNKRKLSTALALIGEPDVVLLDEPSTGIDVGARRFLWDFLGEIRQRGHALVLTSHSMDECEVLCTRLTVMVHGEFRCLGSPTQLKDKYGGGYTLTIKAVPKQQEQEEANSSAEPQGLPVDVIRKFVKAEVPAAVLAEENVGLFRYRLGGGELTGLAQKDVSLSDLFAKLEGAMQDPAALKGIISDYTISQTSLEEVFLHFSQEVEPSAFAGAPGDEETAS
jgi:ABC-type multidrug transport system ATPase subunit